jgi:hypothetical protein
MAQTKIPKDVINRIGRAFALLFNRAVMYNTDHPITTQALAEFYGAVSHGLSIFSPVVLIMHQEQFFIEEEPLDPRINTAKMLFHFKKSGVQSLSFEQGLLEKELIDFTAIFIDVAKFVTADAMKEACARKGIANIKINHVFYRKVTEDDEVVDRSKLEEPAADTARESGNLESLVESVLMEELQKSFSIRQVLHNPADASRQLVEAAASAGREQGPEAPAPDDVIVQQLQKFGDAVNQMSAGGNAASTQQLAAAVFDMRRSLLQGIESQKAAGVSFGNEALIKQAADDISDPVLVRLIKEEYQQGRISVQRLGQIIRRLIPEPAELQRLLPKIKEALLEEGMPLTEFLQLTVELKQELQSEELTRIIEKNAEEIGVSGDELIQEISANPKSAVELIYLASELRKGTGDEKVMSELLVDYIERVGSKLALDVAEKHGQQGEAHLQQIMSNIESVLVKRLKTRNIDANVLRSVAERLSQRMDDCMGQLKTQWTLKQKSFTEDGMENPTTTLGVYEGGAQDEKELQSIVEKVQHSVSAEPVNQLAFENLDPEKAAEADKITVGGLDAELPKGILNRDSILYILEKEVARSVRYGTAFSLLMLSIYKITPDKPLPPGSIDREKVFNFMMGQCYRLFRNTDIIGRLDKEKLLVILPMTAGMESRKAMRRILKEIHELKYEIQDTTLTVKLAGSVTTFDKDITPTLNDLVKRAESDIFDMIQRLRNVQSLY